MFSFPNPSKTYFNIYLELPSKDNITIDLVDLNGKILNTINKQNFISESIYLDTSSFSSGIYTLIIKTNTDWMTKKIIIN